MLVYAAAGKSLGVKVEPSSRHVCLDFSPLKGAHWQIKQVEQLKSHGPSAGDVRHEWGII